MRMKFILLACTAHREGEYYVARCKELGTSSFGDTPEEAFRNLDEATLLFLNTLEDLGECEKLLAEKDVRVYDWRDGAVVSKRVECEPGALGQTMLVPVAA